jgi:hypothetical protein
MELWRTMEQYIDENLSIGESFTSTQYAADQGITGARASKHIQGYLQAQRGERSRTRYVLKREPGTRTHSARWSVGERSADIRTAGITFSDDVKKKWMSAVEPDIRRIAAINPKAARRAENIIEATLDGAIKVLEAAVRT